MGISKGINLFIYLKICIKYLFCGRFFVEYWDGCRVLDVYCFCFFGVDSLVGERLLSK